MSIVYNEIDPFAVDWLDGLMVAGEIPGGPIDARSIRDVRGDDLRDAVQFHTFAGIGGWSLALRLAGWPEDREVWTGSCPCQPFSSAGKGHGIADARHLWPDFFRLIAERRPATVFGEQVASKAGREWLVGVRSDLEGVGYAVGAADLCAASVGAPHIRQRLYWVAARRLSNAERAERWSMSGGRHEPDGANPRWQETTSRDRADSQVGGLAHNKIHGREEQAQPGRCGTGTGTEGELMSRSFHSVDVGRVAGSTNARYNDARQHDGRRTLLSARPEQCGSWRDSRIVPCTDGKARRTGTRVFPLAYGLPRGVGDDGTWRKGLARGASRARVGMLKGSGNAIVPELAAEFILSFLDAESDLRSTGALA